MFGWNRDDQNLQCCVGIPEALAVLTVVEIVNP